MRDPQRIDRMLEQLREIWIKVPDWRLGQIIVNAVKPTEPCPQIFGVEDSNMEKLFARLLQRLADAPAE